MLKVVFTKLVSGLVDSSSVYPKFLTRNDTRAQTLLKMEKDHFSRSFEVLFQCILTGCLYIGNVCLLAGVSAFEVGINGFCEGSCNWQGVLVPHGERTGSSGASLKTH